MAGRVLELLLLLFDVLETFDGVELELLLLGSRIVVEEELVTVGLEREPEDFDDVSDET